MSIESGPILLLKITQKVLSGVPILPRINSPKLDWIHPCFCHSFQSLNFSFFKPYLQSIVSTRGVAKVFNLKSCVLGTRKSLSIYKYNCFFYLFTKKYSKYEKSIKLNQPFYKLKVFSFSGDPNPCKSFSLTFIYLTSF